MRSIELIAEIGVNHNGNISIAKKLIKNAAIAGADYAKFQIFKADNLSTKNSKKANYQNKNIGKNVSQYEMLKKYEINKFFIKECYKICKINKIKFLASCFDIESLKFYSTIDNYCIKIPSGEITNLNLIKYAADKFKKIIISTGMSNLSEINSAVKTILKSKNKSRQDITILQCTSDYPALSSESNIRCLNLFKKKFKTNIGYSDHTLGSTASILAVSLGAKIIEKHFTISKHMKGPDHKASMNFKELKIFNTKIRSVESILGDGIKRISSNERKNIKYVRKSLYAKKEIRKGEKFSEKNIIAKRPLNGIPANKFLTVIGRRAKKNFKIDEKIKV